MTQDRRLAIQAARALDALLLVQTTLLEAGLEADAGSVKTALELLTKIGDGATARERARVHG